MPACDLSQMSLQQKAAQLMISFRFGQDARSDFMIGRGWGGMILSIWDYTTLAESRAMLAEKTCVHRPKHANLSREGTA